MEKKVLICDDDEGIIDVIKIVLEDKGYLVQTCVDSRTIYETVAKFKPKIILLDLWMPELGGDEITRELKNNKDTKHIPIIIISASKDTIIVAKESGAEGFICKPFDILELEDIVEKYISK